MMCEDPEEHKLIRQVNLTRETNKIDDSIKSLFPLVLVWVRHKEPVNYTHLILFARNYSLIAKSGTSS